MIDLRFPDPSEQRKLQPQNFLPADQCSKTFENPIVKFQSLITLRVGRKSMNPRIVEQKKKKKL